ncbi:MAG: hypothetical protein ABIW38_01045 [Ferruginibacter sp.]
MKQLCFLLAFVPILGMAQVKNVLNSSRYFCKPDKVMEFEKAIGDHAKKYHTGDWKWRVWSIETGPDAGGYMVTEGPSDWLSIDGRGDINPAHQADWNKSVAPYTVAPYSSAYYVFQQDRSTVQMTDYADKIVINHMMVKPGKIATATELIKKLKAVWESDKESIAVYSTVASGEPEFITVSRLRGGLKELADDYRKPMAERFNGVYGAGSWETYLKDYENAVSKRWSELLVYKPGLSSK